MMGLSDSSRRKKLPSGPSKRRMSRSFMTGAPSLAPNIVGEHAARHVADVQFERAFLVRRGGDRVAAALAVAQQEFDILAGQELQALGGRQLQPDHDHVVGSAF